MSIATMIAEIGRSLTAALGLPVGPDDGWDAISAAMADHLADFAPLYANSCAVMADATQSIGA